LVPKGGGGWIVLGDDGKYRVTDDFVKRCFESSPIIHDAIDMYSFAKEHFREGTQNTPIALMIGDVGVQIIFLPLNDEIVSFGIFFPEQKHSRKTICIKKDGSFFEDVEGVIPAFDIADNEPNFDGLNKAELISMVWDKIKN
jgi:hypothetical protein